MGIFASDDGSSTGAADRRSAEVVRESCTFSREAVQCRSLNGGTVTSQVSAQVVGDYYKDIWSHFGESPPMLFRVPDSTENLHARLLHFPKELRVL